MVGGWLVVGGCWPVGGGGWLVGGGSVAGTGLADFRQQRNNQSHHDAGVDAGAEGGGGYDRLGPPGGRPAIVS